MEIGKTISAGDNNQYSISNSKQRNKLSNSLKKKNEINNNISNISEILDNASIAYIKGTISNGFEITGYIPFSPDEKFERVKERIALKFSKLGKKIQIVCDNYNINETMSENNIKNMDTISVQLLASD